ncbi:hypothetical protein [Aquipuribacter hungaricus]|uniref:Bulb-type lectin domain-containing protein n=1 Tax=Aquipuribacter hungaricus TaxID=545624 RepID=A0ABV7WEE5_9MICO
MTVRRTTVAAGVLVAALVAGAGPATAGTGVLQGLQEPSAVRDAVAAADGVAAAAVPTSLTSGETLQPGQSLVSPSGRYALTLRTDGALVLVLQPTRFNPAPVVLERLGQGEPGARLIMQEDGNLVMYDPDGSVAENYATEGTGADYFVVQDDRNVVLYSRYAGSDQTVRSFQTISLERLVPGQALLSGDRMISSDLASVLVMQGDGNLVLYRYGQAVFQSGTNSPDNVGADAVLQSDGNFVVYAGSRAVFSTRTVTTEFPDSTVLRLGVGEFSVVQGAERLSSVYGSAWTSPTVEFGQSLLPGDRRRSPDGRGVLVFQADENLVHYRDGRAVWQSGTRLSGANLAVMQEDGNFVVYAVGDSVPGGVEVLAQTRTQGNPGATLVVPDAGQVYVRSEGGRVLYPR